MRLLSAGSKQAVEAGKYGLTDRNEEREDLVAAWSIGINMVQRVSYLGANVDMLVESTKQF